MNGFAVQLLDIPIIENLLVIVPSDEAILKRIGIGNNCYQQDNCNRNNSGLLFPFRNL
jgi:hypothetical protein